MNKKLLIYGIVSGVLSGLASIIYFEIYQYLMLSNFETVVNWGSMLAACLIGCLLMMLGYWLAIRFNRASLTKWLNVIYAILSFASIVGAMNAKLPFDVEFPELFPGLVVPMHFFPALCFFGLYPFFFNQSDEIKVESDSIS